MKKTNAQEKVKPIIASIFLDLVLALKINQLTRKFISDNPYLDTNPYEQLSIEDIVLLLFLSDRPKDAESRTKLAEILEIQKRRFAIYSFAGCEEENFKNPFECDPPVTCPVGGVPPCCKAPENTTFSKMIFENDIKRIHFKKIVFWGDNVTIQAFDENDALLASKTVTIGVVEDILIKSIDFDSVLNKMKYIKISDPYVIIQVPTD